MSNLLLGSEKSLDIVKLQLQLRHLDLYTGLIDGIFSDQIDKAVRLFQTKAGLKVDGIVGPFTKTLLLNKTKDNLFILFLHCAASPEGVHFSGDQIRLMHTLPVAQGGRGWSRTGYSDIFELSGKVVNLRSWDQDDHISEWEYTFGVKEKTLLNENSRHICYIGGMSKDMKFPKDTRTQGQKDNMETYIKFTLMYNPKIIIAGHYQVQDDRECPCFDVPLDLRKIGIPEYNIPQWGRLSN